MKTNLLILVIFSLCIFSCNTSSKECAKYIGQDLIMDFDVRQFGMNSSEYQKYMNNEMTSQQKEIDLQVSQDEDITTVSFIKLGGHAEIQCLEILTDKQKLDIINYESNYAREITVRRIGYKIHNPNKYELGKIDFKFFE